MGLEINSVASYYYTKSDKNIFYLYCGPLTNLGNVIIHKPR